MYRILACIFLFCLASHNAAAAEPLTLLNVSYDPTREFYGEYNTLFTQHWKEKTGGDIHVSQSHGGSGKQARAVIDGLKADVVTLALAYDIDMIAQNTPLIPANWQAKLPHDSTPYQSTVVFLVRKGNPKHIQDWDDLVKEGIDVITPNPKVSGGARWNYLAGWAWAMKKYNNDETQARGYMTRLFRHVPVLDTGARGATTNFVERGLGDVLIAWESEALLISKKMSPGEYDIVIPSLTILAEPPVAVAEGNAAKNGTSEAAREYLEYLYSAPAQKLAAEHFYRPVDEKVAGQYAAQFPVVNTVTIAQLGGWKAMQDKHFAEGGIFDQIYGN